MRREIPAAIALLAALMLTSGCGERPAPLPAPGAGVTSAGPDLSNLTALEAKAKAAALSAAETSLESPQELSERIRFGNGMQHSCNARLFADKRVVGRYWSGWSSAGSSPYLEQWSFAFDREVAADAVAEARAALTCSSYDQQGAVYSVLKDSVRELDGDVPGFSYCESVSGARQDHDSYVCTMILGRADTVCNLQVSNTELAGLRKVISGIEQAAIRRCAGL